MMPRLEHIGPLTQHFLGRITGDFYQGRVHVHDDSVVVADQHPFPGTVEHHRSLTQTLLIQTLAAQASAHAQKTEQSGTRKEYQSRTDTHPHVAIYPLPACQLG